MVPGSPPPICEPRPPEDWTPPPPPSRPPSTSSRALPSCCSSAPARASAPSGCEALRASAATSMGRAAEMADIVVLWSVPSVLEICSRAGPFRLWATDSIKVGIRPSWRRSELSPDPSLAAQIDLEDRPDHERRVDVGPSGEELLPAPAVARQRGGHAPE